MDPALKHSPPRSIRSGEEVLLPVRESIVEMLLRATTLPAEAANLVNMA